MRWREYFEELLNIAEEENHTQETQHPSPPTEAELGVDKPTLQEVKEVIKKVRNNKAPGGRCNNKRIDKIWWRPPVWNIIYFNEIGLGNRKDA
jgi:hypothetical protein